MHKVHRARWIQKGLHTGYYYIYLRHISPVYCPPKFNNTKDQYLDFLKSLGNRYLAGGDYKAKQKPDLPLQREVNCMKQ